MHEEDRNVLKLAHEFGHHSTGKEKVELSARLHPVLFVKNPFDSIYIQNPRNGNNNLQLGEGYNGRKASQWRSLFKTWISSTNRTANIETNTGSRIKSRFKEHDELKRKNSGIPSSFSGRSYFGYQQQGSVELERRRQQQQLSYPSQTLEKIFRIDRSSSGTSRSGKNMIRREGKENFESQIFPLTGNGCSVSGRKSIVLVLLFFFSTQVGCVRTFTI